MVFQRNATFGEVLQNVLTGFIITEPNISRSRVRRRRCPKTKRVLGWSGFALGCHAQTIQKREREREREVEKYQSTIISKEGKEWYVCMKNAWTCDMQQNKYHGLNPIQTYQHTRFQHIRHTSKMHETLWKCKCDAMHEHIGSFKHNPTQKFHNELNNFEKPQKF